VTYYYQVTAADWALPYNESVPTEPKPVTPRDQTPPEVPQALEAAASNRLVSLTWAPNTDADLAGYNVYRSESATGGFTRTNPTLVTKASYEDAQVMNGTTYYYYIRAQDDALVPNESVPSGTVSARPERVFVLSLPAGAHMIAIPSTGMPSAPAAALTFTHDQWLLARWWKPNEPTAGYHFADASYADPTASLIPPDTTGAKPTVPYPPAGLGFWVVMAAPGELRFAGQPPPGGGSYRVHLYEGWNLVGNPWEGAINWRGLVTSPASAIEPVGWQWDHAQGYVPLFDANAANLRSQVASLSSFWVRAVQECDLTLPASSPTVASTSSAETREAVRPLFEGTEWTVRLVARAAGSSDEANWVGVATSQRSLPRRIHEPPPPSRYVSLSITGANNNKLAIDLREPRGGEHTWDMLVETDIPNVPVMVAAPDLRELPRDWSVVLEDMETGREVFLRTAPTYEFRSGPEGARRRLRLVARRNSLGALRIVGLQATMIRQGEAALSFNMTRDAETTVEVLNAAGRVVRVVEKGRSRSVGRHEVYWNRSTDGGARAPGGVYTIKIAARSDNGEITHAVRMIRLGP